MEFGLVMSQKEVVQKVGVGRIVIALFGVLAAVMTVVVVVVVEMIALEVPPVRWSVRSEGRQTQIETSSHLFGHDDDDDLDDDLIH